MATSAFKVGFGYRVVLPVAAYFTWHGTNLEGRGLVPDIEEPLSPEAVWSGEDNQLKRAVRLPEIIVRPVDLKELLSLTIANRILGRRRT